MKARFPQFHGRTGERLPRVERALAGYRRAVPAKSRLPMPWPIAAATAVVLVLDGFREAALQTLTLHDGYFRPGETRAMRIEDLVPPVPGSSGSTAVWSLVVAPDSRGEVTKTATSDDTIPLDGLPWLGDMLRSHARARPADHFLFQEDQNMMRKAWQRAQASLGLKGTCLYQHRHGGASHDALTKARPLLEVMARGRWRTQTTLLRYAKPGKLFKLMDTMTEDTRTFVEWCAFFVQHVMNGTRSPPLPPSRGGDVRPLKAEMERLSTRSDEKRPPATGADASSRREAAPVRKRRASSSRARLASPPLSPQPGPKPSRTRSSATPRRTSSEREPRPRSSAGLDAATSACCGSVSRVRRGRAPAIGPEDLLGSVLRRPKGCGGSQASAQRTAEKSASATATRGG